MLRRNKPWKKSKQAHATQTCKQACMDSRPSRCTRAVATAKCQRNATCKPPGPVNHDYQGRERSIQLLICRSALRKSKHSAFEFESAQASSEAAAGAARAQASWVNCLRKRNYKRIVQARVRTSKAKSRKPLLSPQPTLPGSVPDGQSALSSKHTTKASSNSSSSIAGLHGGQGQRKREAA
jgi:hypothetical protein